MRCGEKEEIQVNEMEPGRRGPGRFLGLIIIYTLEFTPIFFGRSIQPLPPKRMTGSRKSI